MDSKGNLYVANSGGNDILVYNTSYTQVTSKTNTENIINPSGVAFDLQGNLWVANYGSSNGGSNGSVAEYTNGVQNTNNSITDGIMGPGAIALDALGNVFVQNANSNVTVYGQGASFSAPAALLKTLSLGFPVFGMAVGKGTFAWGGNTTVTYTSESAFLIDGSNAGRNYPNDTGSSLAADNRGYVFEGNLDGSVNVNVGGTDYSFITLGFAPAGIAVDNVRQRIYFSNYNANSISVYSLRGTLLHVIE